MFAIEKIHKNEEGMGFVESLVAIAVGGIACIALFSVAISVIREANNNEIRDAMNMYGIEGMDFVRAEASRNYSSLPQCEASNPSKKIEAYINGGVITELTSTEQPCSVIGSSAGKCEALTMPKSSKNFFYREITFTGAGDSPIDGNGNCVNMRVEVSVGLLVNAGKTDPPRGNLSERTIVGYVFK